jgi:hypothetical protein
MTVIVRFSKEEELIVPESLGQVLVETRCILQGRLLIWPGLCPRPGR